MKPFDLEKAKAGFPVVTRDGRPARIICFDRIDDRYSIIALITEEKHRCEIINSYTIDGKCNIGENSLFDLFMAPTKVKKYANIYEYNVENKIFGFLHDTVKEAIDHKLDGCVATIPIEWEE